MTIRLTHSAESELLRLVLEKIAAGESVAIGFHIAPARIARDRRVAPAEFPSSMLGTEPPAFKAWKRIVARGLYPNIETDPQWHCAGRREVVLKGLHRPRSRRKSGPHRTHRWRGQSRANLSLNPNFPASRENAGNFVDSGVNGASKAAKTAAKSVCYEPIPDASEQGIFGARAGNLIGRSGNFSPRSGTPTKVT